MKTHAWMAMLLASLITTGWVHHADAQPVQVSAGESKAARKVEHYGWQILLTDAASVVAGFAIGNYSPNAGVATFAGGYLLGGSLVHLGHGNPGRALGSVALRAGLPALGVSLVLLPEQHCDSEGGCDDFGRAIAVLATGVFGMIAASAIDWSVLSRSIEEVPVKRGPTLVPQVSAGADGSLQLGVQGRF
jgi:hypothetical protein